MAAKLQLAIFLTIIAVSHDQHSHRFVVGLVHQPLVHHHLRQHQLNVVLFLSCDQRSQFESVRLANQLNVWPSSLDICKRVYPSSDGHVDPLDESPFHHASQRVGVVLDLQCPERCLRPLLAAVSRQWLFHRRYVWLLFGKNVDDVGKWLDGENVNVDAEITAATKRVPDNDKVVVDGYWDLWDVYNPSFVRGGRLNVTHLQSWRSAGMSDPIKTTISQSKHEKRRNLRGLQLRGVLTVSE